MIMQQQCSVGFGTTTAAASMGLVRLVSMIILTASPKVSQVVHFKPGKNKIVKFFPLLKVYQLFSLVENKNWYHAAKDLDLSISENGSRLSVGGGPLHSSHLIQL